MKILSEIGRVIRYALTRETKVFEIVRFMNDKILLAENSYRVQEDGE